MSFAAWDRGEVHKRSNRGSAESPRGYHRYMGEHGTGGREGTTTEGLHRVPGHEEGGWETENSNSAIRLSVITVGSKCRV